MPLHSVSLKTCSGGPDLRIFREVRCLGTATKAVPIAHVVIRQLNHCQLVNNHLFVNGCELFGTTIDNFEVDEWIKRPTSV